MWNKKEMSQVDATLTSSLGQIVSQEWDFKVKFGFCYISAKNGSIATKQKANITIKS